MPWRLARPLERDNPNERLHGGLYKSLFDVKHMEGCALGSKGNVLVAFSLLSYAFVYEPLPSWRTVHGGICKLVSDH